MSRFQLTSWAILSLALILITGTDFSSAQEQAPAPARPEPFDPIKQKIADDWDKLQGTWEYRSNINGQQLRMVKSIQDHHEVLRAYDAAGKVLREQTADLKIEIQGNLHTLKWSNAKVTAGAGLGTNIANGTAVITFKEGRWISVCGLVEGEPWSVYTEIWSRPIEADETAQ